MRAVMPLMCLTPVVLSMMFVMPTARTVVFASFHMALVMLGAALCLT
jgi:hypothetical protein